MEEPCWGQIGNWTVLCSWSFWGIPQPESLSSNNWKAYNLHAMFNIRRPVSYYTQLQNGLTRILKSIRWIPLVRLIKVNLPPLFGVNILEVGFWCCYDDYPLIQLAVIFYQTPVTDPPPYLESPSCTGILSYTRCISPYANICMFGSIDKEDYFKLYLWNLYKWIHPLDLRVILLNWLPLLFVLHWGIMDQIMKID